MTGIQSPTIQIDGKITPLADMSDNAKAQVQNPAIVDAEIKRLQTLIEIATAAQQSFIAALRNELNKSSCLIIRRFQLNPTPVLFAEKAPVRGLEDENYGLEATQTT